MTIREIADLNKEAAVHNTLMDVKSLQLKVIRAILAEGGEDDEYSFEVVKV